MNTAVRASWVLAVAALVACEVRPPVQSADLLLLNGRVYSFAWADPARDGTPAPDAPYDADGWRPDAEAVAVRDGRIVFVGGMAGAEAYRAPNTWVIDVGGATVLPGLIDSHVHIANLGATLERVNLVGVESEEDAVERVAEWAAEVPDGDWIIGWGWDEGAWANRYPDSRLLSERVPNHPVYLRGLHGFAVWANRLALERAGITSESEAPAGGEIRRDSRGEPSGILVNNAVDLLDAALPPVTAGRIKSRVLRGLERMAVDGFVAVHEAGAGPELVAALESLESEGQLPIRVYVMLDGANEALLGEWVHRGPDSGRDGMLVTRSVKAFYDGALGSRGARLLEDYSDRRGHRGVSGHDYGFDEERIAEMAGAGFQIAIHAIGDAGVRGTLDFFEMLFDQRPETRGLRHRIEHAQVVHPDDFERFPALGIIASMEPPHAVEDMVWAEDRLGPERVKGAYAWRTMREVGARLVFNSDLPGSDHDIFYALHAVATRRNRGLEPEGGWYPEQRLTIEEALRGYTVWAAYVESLEGETGVLAAGRRADITVTDMDPLAGGGTRPEELLDGSILLTVAGGQVVHQRQH